MNTDKKTFGEKLRGFFLQARENLSKKEQGKSDYVFSKKNYSFSVDDQIQVKLGLGQFNTPAYIPWIGFIGPGQKPQNGIYPVILCYIKQHKILVVYGVSAVSRPVLNWGNVKNKENGTPLTIRDYFSNYSIENHDYDDCYVYSGYSDELNDDDISNIYDDIQVLLNVYKNVLGVFENNSFKQKMDIPQKKVLFDAKLYSFVRVGQSMFGYRTYITAIKSKPFLLLAGISGTGKSRIVRELARACWVEDSEDYKAQKPKNFEMVQVKPNWHDSSELIGYVSRLGVDKEGNPRPAFVAGDFLKFVARAWENPEVPYFLCLDEMNLAPVEQYFAEYLSVIESRKCDENGVITTDPILKKCNEQWYFDLIAQLTTDKDIRAQFNKDGIAIPQNLIVVGTVNMDETTFSFSRKVLDRAMTIEMNEVDLYGGLDSQYEKIGKLEAGNLIGTAVEAVDVYQENKDVCDTVLKYLDAVNTELEGTPFKVAYRTRNEFLLYVVNNLPYNKDKDGNDLEQNFVIVRALDEITSMKILSRIEGDETKIGKLLDKLSTTIGEQLKVVSEKEYSAKKDDGEKVYSVSLAKLEEMKKRLEGGYTSFWS